MKRLIDGLYIGDPIETYQPNHHFDNPIKGILIAYKGVVRKQAAPNALVTMDRAVVLLPDNRMSIVYRQRNIPHHWVRLIEVFGGSAWDAFAKLCAQAQPLLNEIEDFDVLKMRVAKYSQKLNEERAA